MILVVQLVVSCAYFKGPSGTAAPKDSTTAASLQGTPSVSIPERIFNFGKEADGDEFVHVFIVKNTGTGVLEIKEVESD